MVKLSEEERKRAKWRKSAAKQRAKNKDNPEWKARRRASANKNRAKNKDNPEWRAKRRASQAKFLAENPDYHAKASAKFRAENPGYSAKYYVHNKEKVKSLSANYYSKNKKKVIARGTKYRRKRYKTDPTFKMACVLRDRLRKTIKAVKGAKKCKSTLKLLGCTLEFFQQHLESTWKEGMTWSNHGKGDDKWHVDHIRPVSSFDLLKAEEQAKCFHWSNMQALWQVENLEKGSSY